MVSKLMEIVKKIGAHATFSLQVGVNLSGISVTVTVGPFD